MMDTHEAIKYLGIYSDNLVSLSHLIGADVFGDKVDQEMNDIHDGLKIKLAEKRKQAMDLALEIVTANRSASDHSLSNILGVSAAIERYVLADNQANEALKLRRESFAEGMIRIHREVAAREAEAKEKVAAQVPAADVSAKEARREGSGQPLAT